MWKIKIMKKLILALFLTAIPSLAFAETQRNPCYYTAANPGPGTGCVPVSTVNPLPTSTTVSTSVGITPTDRTIASTSGSSQQIMAANAARHSLTIENTGNANCGVNPTGGTAVIGGAGTITLAPLGSYAPKIPTLSAVTIICTSGQPIYGDEN